MNKNNEFYNLTADWVMTALEQLGFEPTGKYFKLNSYENRVYDIFLEDGSSQHKNLIVKVYRPNRWPLEALQEEQDFLNELDDNGIPVIKSLSINSKNIFEYQNLYFTICKKGVGRLPQELLGDQLKSVGRVLAHIHNVGEGKETLHRKHLLPDDYGWPSLDILNQFVAPEIWSRYEKASTLILEYLDAELENHNFQRIHGDCHRGNLIKSENSDTPPFFFVDFDDFCMGPVIQDFWMLLSGPLKESKQELDQIISGYEEFRNFPDGQLHLIEPLRGLRIIHYAAWIARRWKDPVFPSIFPNYTDYVFWAEEVEILEKIAWSLD